MEVERAVRLLNCESFVCVLRGRMRICQEHNRLACQEQIVIIVITIFFYLQWRSHFDRPIPGITKLFKSYYMSFGRRVFIRGEAIT